MSDQEFLFDIEEIELIEKEDSELRKTRVALCAALYHEVMKENPGNPHKWEEWAVIALHYYEKHEARLIDSREPALIGQWRPSIKYLNKDLTRSLVTTYLAEMGVWILLEPFKGIRLAKNESEIKKSHKQLARALKGRGDKMSYRASAMNGVVPSLKLPVVSVQALQQKLADGVS